MEVTGLSLMYLGHDTTRPLGHLLHSAVLGSDPKALEVSLSINSLWPKLPVHLCSSSFSSILGLLGWSCQLCPNVGWSFCQGEATGYLCLWEARTWTLNDCKCKLDLYRHDGVSNLHASMIILYHPGRDLEVLSLVHFRANAGDLIATLDQDASLPHLPVRPENMEAPFSN